MKYIYIQIYVMSYVEVSVQQASHRAIFAQESPGLVRGRLDPQTLSQLRGREALGRIYIYVLVLFLLLVFELFKNGSAELFPALNPQFLSSGKRFFKSSPIPRTEELLHSELLPRRLRPERSHAGAAPWKAFEASRR